MPLHNAIKEIEKAINIFGYIVQDHVIDIHAIAKDRYKVSIDGEYFGIFDTVKNTFID